MSNESEIVIDDLRGRNAERAAEKRVRGQSKSRDMVGALEATVVKVELAMADMRDRLDLAEQEVEKLKGKGDCQSEELAESTLAKINSTIEAQRNEIHTFQAMVIDTMTKIQAEVGELRASVEETKADWALCKRAVASGPTTTMVNVAPRLETPKPKEFNGKRDAKELDNFLWHMDRYFEAVNVDERVKVRNASLYLTDLAAIWWRRKHAEIEKGTCTIDTWEDLKNELKRQFYPENVAHEARKRMKELKHTRSIREYVEEFSSLMLQISSWRKAMVS